MESGLGLVFSSPGAAHNWIHTVALVGCYGEQGNGEMQSSEMLDGKERHRTEVQ